MPDGSNWKATMLIEYPDVNERKRELARLIGVEDRLFVEVEGLARVYAIADEDMDRENDEKTSAVHFVAFRVEPRHVRSRQGRRQREARLRPHQLPGACDDCHRDDDLARQRSEIAAGCLEAFEPQVKSALVALLCSPSPSACPLFFLIALHVVLISPAKSLDYESPLTTDAHTQPLFARQSSQLIEVLKKKTPAQIASLMKLSDSLSSLNVARYQAWSDRSRPEIHGRPRWLSMAMCMAGWTPKH